MTGAEFKPSLDALSDQCRLVLSALQDGPCTTAQLRVLLGPSSSPAARVLDLRKAGHPIATHRSKRQGLYVLEREAAR